MNYNDVDKIVLRNVYKITKCKMNPCNDPRTGRPMPHIRTVDSNGNMEKLEEDKIRDNSKLVPLPEDIEIELYDGKVFDLTDNYERSLWEAIKYSPLIAEDRWAKLSDGTSKIDGDAERYGSGEWYVETPGKESMTFNNKRQKVNNAQKYLFDDSRENIYIKARLIGAKMNGYNFDEVLEFMLKAAEKNPDQIIDLYTGSDMRLRILFVTAIDKDVIKFSNGVYLYNHNAIGVTEEASILFLKQAVNKDIYRSIEIETFPELVVDSDILEETKRVMPKIKK